MRIATWNVNGLRARSEFLQLWLAERKPDIVGLQELKMENDKFPHAEFERLGYRALVHGQKAWNGVAILSRTELQLTQRGLPGQEEFGARLIAAQGGGLGFVTVYCPNGKHVEHDDFPRKLQWFEDLHRYLEDHHEKNSSLVLCGDFNIVPTALDSWNEEGSSGKIFHTEEERSRYRGLLDWGLVDLYRQQNPGETMFSWWDYRGGAFYRNQGLRIDFLLATPAAADRLQRVEIDRDYRKKKDGLTASDHAPVWADLRE